MIYIISSQNICQSYLVKSACCFTITVLLAELIESYEILNNIFSRGDTPEKKLKPCKNAPVNTRKD